MPKPLGRKGFYVSAPLLGVTIFLIAALIAAIIQTESDARISVARSASSRDKLAFISQAILADSYDVLLQHNLERLTTEFLEGEHHMIGEGETWKQSLKNNLVKRYSDELGEALGMDIEAYSKAYSNIPGVDYCEVELASGAYGSLPSVYDSGEEGTIIVKGQSYGERVHCLSKDPEGDIYVDILGRYYRVNIRMASLYDAARWIIGQTKIAMNQGAETIEEPIAIWESPRWLGIDRNYNIPLDVADKRLMNSIIDGSQRPWLGETARVANRVIALANAYIGDTVNGLGLVGIRLEDLEILEGTEDEYELNDFDISCVEDQSRQYRNCMPYKTRITLGDSTCSRGEPPKGSPTSEFYTLEKRVDMDCGSNKCPERMSDVMGDILKPIGSVCVEYYANLDYSVRPVCKKWEAKAKSVVIKGFLKDDNAEFITSGRNFTALMFQGIEPNVDTYSVWADRLKCDKGGKDEELYRDNVRIILERMKINLGMIRDPGSSMTMWADLGSGISDLVDVNLKEIYRNVMEGKSPIPCFISGARSVAGCEALDTPKVEIQLEWEETRNRCLAKIDTLCNALCGGRATEQFKDDFCNSLFTEGGHSIGEGTLKCEGAGGCEETAVRIRIASFLKKIG